MAASDLTCFKCGSGTPSKRATYTRDGCVACPNCTAKLGIRTVPREGFMEITRMRDRGTMEKMRERAAKRLHEAQESHSGATEVYYLEAVQHALDWALGETEKDPVEAGGLL